MMTKTFGERLFSWRMLHGVLMTFSWCQMVGRIGVTNPFTSWKGCWSYPAYKSSAMSAELFAVDSQSSPPFPMENGKFLALITVPTVLIVLLVAVSTTYCFYRMDLRNTKNNSSVSPENSQALVN